MQPFSCCWKVWKWLDSSAVKRGHQQIIFNTVVELLDCVGAGHQHQSIWLFIPYPQISIFTWYIILYHLAFHPYSRWFFCYIHFSGVLLFLSVTVESALSLQYICFIQLSTVKGRACGGTVHLLPLSLSHHYILHPPQEEYQSCALSALRLVFRPHCALVTWHPDSISSRGFCVSHLQEPLWPPPPATGSNQVTQLQAANLCSMLLLRDWTN